MKRSVRAVLCFVLACFSVVFSVSSGVSAADGEAVTADLDSLLTTSADLYANESNVQAFSSFSLGASTFALSSPNYNFDVSKVDFYSDAPKQVLNVYEMAVQPAVFSDGTLNTSALNPFVAVYVTNSSYQLIVGCNVGFYVRSTKNTGTYPRLCVGYLYSGNGGSAYRTHYCYYRTFKLDGTPTSEWQNLKSTVHGSGLLNYYTGWATPDDVRDIYVYGANAPICRDSLSVTYLETGDDATYQAVTFNNCYVNGFGSVPSTTRNSFPSIYFSNFTLPTYEAWLNNQEESRHKSLLDKIKEIPTLIINGLKSLFIPSDGFFTSYFDELNNFFKDRFGFLYELPAFAVTLFQKLIDFNPDVSGYSMTFPKLQAPEAVDGDVVWHDISEEQTFDFTFLEDQPFKTLYSVYRSLIWLGYCILLLNLVKRKFSSVFGGD